MYLAGCICREGLKDWTGCLSRLADHSVVRLHVHLQLTHDVKSPSLGSVGGGGGLIEHTSVHLQGRKLPVHVGSAITKILVIIWRSEFTFSLSECEPLVDD